MYLEEWKMFNNAYIQYIGANDHDLDLFESQYPLKNGVSYNSYVIFDEKIVVMDTIDERMSEWLDQLTEALDGRKVDYLVISHLEPDHAANIQTLCQMYPHMKLIGNAQTFNMLPNYFDIEGLQDRKIVVKEGELLSIGKNSLQFFMAPMVHWPEVMLTYIPEEKYCSRLMLSENLERLIMRTTGSMKHVVTTRILSESTEFRSKMY